MHRLIMTCALALAIPSVAFAQQQAPVDASTHAAALQLLGAATVRDAFMRERVQELENKIKELTEKAKQPAAAEK